MKAMYVQECLTFPIKTDTWQIQGRCYPYLGFHDQDISSPHPFHSAVCNLAADHSLWSQYYSLHPDEQIAMPQLYYEFHKMSLDDNNLMKLSKYMPYN